MPRRIQNLTRHGNAYGVTIPRVMLTLLGWLPGQGLVVEMTADNSVLIRMPVQDDFSPIRPPRVLHGPELAAR